MIKHSARLKLKAFDDGGIVQYENLLSKKLWDARETFLAHKFALWSSASFNFICNCKKKTDWFFFLFFCSVAVIARLASLNLIWNKTVHKSQWSWNLLQLYMQCHKTCLFVQKPTCLQMTLMDCDVWISCNPVHLKFIEFQVAAEDGKASRLLNSELNLSVFLLMVQFFWPHHLVSTSNLVHYHWKMWITLLKVLM